MQTKAGGRTLVATMTKRHGSYEAFCEDMRKKASKGGRKGRSGGYASEKVDANGMTGRDRARYWGVVGGRISKRTKKAAV